jgi:predicted MFS family arabinose efflux permease
MNEKTMTVSMNTEAHPLSKMLTGVFAASAGFSVATLYYCQPMLGILADHLGASGHLIGWVPTLTQLGYALGILLLAPLGDRYDRRAIILIKCGLLILALLGAALSPSLMPLLLASLGIGLMATMAQDIVPAAATMAPEARRGKVVGTVMTGLLLGILLSRVVSGFVAEWAGWRAMFGLAAVSMCCIWGQLYLSLPHFKPTTTLSYPQLLGSLGKLWVAHASLRRAAIAQGLISMSFSAFWSTLAVMLHTGFHLGSSAAGLFGLAGAAGALMAPIAGRMADRYGPGFVARSGAGLVLVSFLAMLGLSGLPVTQNSQMLFLILCTLGFDLGVQVSLIAHQTIVYSIDAHSRSRLNAVLFVAVFIGMAAGSVVASTVLSSWGWSGVTAFAAVAALGALILRLRN